MRFTSLVSLLLLTACTIRAGEFGTPVDANGGLSFTAQDQISPTETESAACATHLWRGSRSPDYPDGQRSQFCD